MIDRKINQHGSIALFTSIAINRPEDSHFSNLSEKKSQNQQVSGLDYGPQVKPRPHGGNTLTDRSALLKLETGQRAKTTVETLLRYAKAVGKRLVLSLADA